MKRKWFALLLLSSCLALPATAQVAQEIDSISSQSEAPTAGMDGLVEKVNIITRTKTPTELPENDPVALDLGFVDIPGVSKTLTEGVTAKAYARYVSVDDMKIGQLVLSSVGKGNRTEPLNSDNFVAQFNLDQTATSLRMKKAKKRLPTQVLAPRKARSAQTHHPTRMPRDIRPRMRWM